MVTDHAEIILFQLIVQQTCDQKKRGGGGGGGGGDISKVLFGRSHLSLN